MTVALVIMILIVACMAITLGACMVRIMKLEEQVKQLENADVYLSTQFGKHLREKHKTGSSHVHVNLD